MAFLMNIPRKGDEEFGVSAPPLADGASSQI
jgi:hypothetical protein